MYKQISIQNLKTFENKQELKISPLTLLYGENSSGKTTLLKTFDIVHNIFVESEVKKGKNVSQKDSPFYRNENIQNISSKKIHYYSTKLNKKNIKIEISLDAKFPKHFTDLSDYFNDINIIESADYFDPSDFLIPNASKSKQKVEMYSVPLKILLDIKYLKQKKESKIDSIEIKRNDGLSIVKFTRINKVYKKIVDPNEVGHKSERFTRLLTRPDRYSPVYHRGRPIAEPDYFVDEELYADYKIKTKEKIVWKPYYESYKENFSKNKNIILRRKFMSLIFNSITKIKQMRLRPNSGNLQDYHLTIYLYNLLKFTFLRPTSEKTLKEIAEEIKLSENHLEYLILKKKKFITEEFLKKVTGRYKDLKIYKAQKWLINLSKQMREDIQTRDGLTELTEKDIKQGKKYKKLRAELEKKKLNFLEAVSCASIIAQNPRVNNLLIKSFLSEEKSKTYSEFTRLAKLETEMIYNVRFTKRSANISWYLVRDGINSSTTFGIFRYISKYINYGIGNIFYKVKNDYKPGFNIDYLFNPTVALLRKCSSEIKQVVNNLVICHPNKTDVSWSVPNEADYPNGFLKNIEKLASEQKDKIRRSSNELKKQDDLGHLNRLESQRKLQDASRINSNGSNFDSIISNNNILRKELNEVLKKVLNLELVVVTPKFLKKILKDQELYNAFREAQRRGMMYPTGRGMYSKKKFIMLKDLRFKKPFFIHGEEVGKGPTNIIPFLAQILSKRPNLTYLVQELENNWHPKYQSKIIELISEVIKKSDNKNFILETHSELFVLQVKKLVEKGILKPEDVSINYISRNQNGESEINNIPLNSEGAFTQQWPGGFFTERTEILTS